MRMLQFLAVATGGQWRRAIVNEKSTVGWKLGPKCLFRTPPFNGQGPEAKLFQGGVSIFITSCFQPNITSQCSFCLCDVILMSIKTSQGDRMDTDINLSLFSPDFVPIDLDEWWAQRFLANIDKLSWHSFGICGCWRIVRRRRPEAGWLPAGGRKQQVGWRFVPCCGSTGWTALGHCNHGYSLHLNSNLLPPKPSDSSVCDTSRWRTTSGSWGVSRQRCSFWNEVKIVFSRSSLLAAYLIVTSLAMFIHRTTNTFINVSTRRRCFSL